MFINDAKGLSELTRKLRDAGSFALDTEFVREKTYRPRLCLLQIATPDSVALVDPLRVDDLTPFLELVFDPDVEKILHSGEQDMEIFFAMGRRVPRGVFDTQVAAALAGHGEKISYGRLVEGLCGARLKKGETYTDWARRPLSPEQVEYAIADVQYLYAMRDALVGELSEMERLDWLKDELRFYEETSSYERDAEVAFRRVRGGTKLKRRELAILKELAAWREREAEKIDWPRGRVLTDDVLVELARRAPRTLDSIKALRGVHPRLVQRAGKGILNSVEQALRIPDSECPQPFGRVKESPEVTAIVGVLDAVVRSRAAEERIAPGYLGSRKDLLALAIRELGVDGNSPGGETEDDPPAILSGWRRKLVGETLLEVLRGERQVAVDPETNSVRVVEP